MRSCVLELVFGVLLVRDFIVQGKDCQMVDQCSCSFDDGSGTVDLSPIGSQDPSNPMIRDVFAPDNYAYSFNPCYPFTEGTCVNAAGCQIDTTNSIYYNIGDSSKVSFSYDGLNVVGTYTADDGARTSVVTFVCDPSQDPPNYQVNGEGSTSQYTFTVTSKHACPSGGGSPDGPHVVVTTSVSISVGSVLTIIFFVVLVVYVIAGVLFMKFKKHESGKGLVPNANFWTSVPGLVKDGFRFTASKVTRKKYTYDSI